jgi:hypothetical protein
MAAFQFYLQSGKKRKAELVGDDGHDFGQKLPSEKGSVRRCVVVMQQTDPLSPKFGAKSSNSFMYSYLISRYSLGVTEENIGARKIEPSVYRPIECSERRLIGS